MSRTTRTSAAMGGSALRQRLRLPARFLVEASKRVGALRQSSFAARVRRPSFIVGCARSGTTMLNYLFDLHPEVANFPSEANELWHPRLYPWHESPIDSPPFFVDPRRFTELSLADRRDDDDLRLKATFGAFQALSRRPVLLNKSVMVSFMLDRVDALFPGARYVHLVRDGRAVALSWIEKEREKQAHPRYASRGYRFDDDTLAEVYARHWQDHILTVDESVTRLGLAGSGRFHEMSYEALCADPARHLGQLAEFLGISPEPFLQADLGHIRNSNGKARTRLTGERLRALTAAAAEALARKGYGEEIAP